MSLRAHPAFAGMAGMLAALGLTLAPGTARADLDDAFNFIVSGALLRDDNVFRLAPGADPQALLGKSSKADRITVTTFGVDVNKPYAQQRFQFSAKLIDYRYANFSQLSFEARNYRAAWLWHLTPVLTGTVSAERQQSLASFADYRTFTGRNIRTSEKRHGDIDWWLRSAWHLVGGVTETRVRNSQTFAADASTILRSAEAGVKYLAGSGSYVRLLQRGGRGEFPGRTPDAAAQLDSRFDQRETELAFSFLLTGKSTLHGRLAHVERTHEHFAARDYAGTTGRLDYNWKPLGKLELNVSAARTIASFQEAFHSYYINDALSIGPVWQVSAKTTARLRLERSRRDYRGPIVPVDPTREDHIRTVMLGLDWTPTRTLTISTSLQRDKRTSNFTGFEFTATTLALSAQLVF